jgi:hypothetical protein
MKIRVDEPFFGQFYLAYVVTTSGSAANKVDYKTIPKTEMT